MAQVLTAREQDVVRSLCEGATTDVALGERLGLAPASVRKHVKRILAKLDLGSRAELVAWAFRNGLAK